MNGVESQVVPVDKVEEDDCPLCFQKLDGEDSQFRPCTCAFKVCRFCWYRLFLGENPVCPMCRSMYSKERALSSLLPSSSVAQIEQLRVFPERGDIAFEVLRTSAYFDPNLDIPTAIFSSTSRLVQVLLCHGLIQANDDFSRMRTKDHIVTAVLRSADPERVITYATRALLSGLVLRSDGSAWEDETRASRRERIKTFVQHGLCLWDHILKTEEKTLMKSPLFSTLFFRIGQLGLYQTGFELAQKTLPVVQRTFGPTHVHALKTEATLALTLSRLRRYDEALTIMKKILPEAERSLGYAHETTLGIREEIGKIFISTGKLEEALKLTNEMHRIYSETLGPTDSKTLLAHFGRGTLLFNLGRHLEALVSFWATYNLQSPVYGEWSLVALRTEAWIGKAMGQMGCWNDAVPLFRDVYDKHRGRLIPDEALVLESALALARALNQLKRHAEADRLCREQIIRLREVPIPTDEDLATELAEGLLNIILEHVKGLLGLGKKWAAETTLIFVMDAYRLAGRDADDEVMKEAEALFQLCRRPT